MDKIERYRQLIKQVLSEHQQIASNTDTVNSQLILNNENDHYQLAYVGWQGGSCILIFKMEEYGFSITVQKSLLQNDWLS